MIKDVLIICSDAGVNGLIKSKVRENANVRIASDLEAALVAHNHPFDLIFIDVTLQRDNQADGFEETMQHFRRFNPLVQFVALTPKEMARKAVLAPASDDRLAIIQGLALAIMAGAKALTPCTTP